jgi:thiamine-phosphate pyrophosphorylase
MSVPVRTINLKNNISDNQLDLYIIITKPVMRYTEIAEICVKKNIRYLQLREKDIDDRELLQIARDIANITKNSETKFIINDRVDICMLSGADGIHLGQDDISFTDAKKILPPDKIIGLSTHNIAQASAALTLKPDYIGFGPIYATPTQRKPDPVVGCELLSQVLLMVDIPVIAIGGIDDTNIHNVINAGAKHICLVRFFMQATDLAERIDRIRN